MTPSMADPNPNVIKRPSRVLCATIYVVLDLDRPHEGFIPISQSSMLHLEQILNKDPEATP